MWGQIPYDSLFGFWHKQLDILKSKKLKQVAKVE